MRRRTCMIDRVVAGELVRSLRLFTRRVRMEPVSTSTRPTMSGSCDFDEVRDALQIAAIAEQEARARKRPMNRGTEPQGRNECCREAGASGVYRSDPAFDGILVTLEMITCSDCKIRFIANP